MIKVLITIADHHHHQASEYQTTTVVESLINQGSGVNAKDEQGTTPLMQVGKLMWKRLLPNVWVKMIMDMEVEEFCNENCF